jgi:(2Fe-2S) ferredoxin
VKPVLRPLPENATGRPRLTVCINDRGERAIAPSCGPRGGAGLVAALEDAIAAAGFDCEVQTIKCLGLCEKGPNIRLAPGNNWFHDVSVEDAGAIVEQAAAHMAASA